jgi:hypothetical protein
MTDFEDRLSFIRAFIEAGPKWNLEARKSSCRAMFWLCDQLQADVDSRCQAPDRIQYLTGKLSGLRHYFDQWSHTGEVDFELVTDYYKGLFLLGDVPDSPLP